MLYEDTYLIHYGIQGQRWGVRRFQNKDGSLTPEGRKRYLGHLDNSFSKVQKEINSKISNKFLKFHRKPVDIVEVRKRGNLNSDEARLCITLASEIFDRAALVEPYITRDVVSAVKDSGSNCYGLENRLKQPSSLAAKIGSDAKDDGVSFEKSAKSIKDAIRYTSISENDGFTDSYFNVKKLLKTKGYDEVRCRNYFDLYKKGEVQHKSVQCIFEDQNGNKFELQFQTPLSQSAKELKIPLYEERRQRGLSKSRKAELERQMRDLAEYVPYPNNVFTIQSHG